MIFKLPRSIAKYPAFGAILPQPMCGPIAVWIVFESHVVFVEVNSGLSRTEGYIETFLTQLSSIRNKPLNILRSIFTQSMHAGHARDKAHRIIIQQLLEHRSEIWELNQTRNAWTWTYGRDITFDISLSTQCHWRRLNAFAASRYKHLKWRNAPKFPTKMVI